MEVIKKTVQRIMTTKPSNDGSGYINIIPDTGVTYYFKIGLTQDATDIGFFDADVPVEVIIPVEPPIIPYYPYYPYGVIEPIGGGNLL